MGGQVEYIEDMLLKGGELWFVYVLFFIFLIWPPILHRLSKKGIAGIIVMLAIACQVIPGDFNDSIFLYPRILSYSVFFLAGYVMKDVNRDILSCNRNFGIVSVLFVVFCCLLVQTIKEPYVWNYFPGLHWLLVCVGIVVPAFEGIPYSDFG